MSIKSRIRTIPDHPKPGVQFRDITTLLQDPEGFRLAVAGLAEPFRGMAIAKVAGIEARGFVLAVALVVPCHRVVRGDGAAGGYRWGRDRKRALLAAERSR